MVSKGNSSLTLKEISNKIPDATLAWYYLGVRQIPCFIKSPLREDKNPSFGLYSPDMKRIYFTDLATKEKGGLYDLLCKMWHCSLNEVLNRIQKDLLTNSDKAEIKQYKKSEIHISHSSNVSIEVKTREWRDYDLKYWNSYGISLEWLKYADVYPISHKIITKNGVKSVINADKYAYAFVEYKEGKTTIKIYQPLVEDKKYKWANTHDRSVISLWTKIPESGDIVVICSSLKDALCLWSNTGIPSIALQGEGYGMSDTAINELKRRYKNVFILFDNDKAGIADSIKLSRQTGFKYLTLPKFEKGKDISDLYKNKGKQTFLSVMKNIFNENPKDEECPF